MNYEQPRQIDPQADRPDAGKWRWTNQRDHEVWPTGYCAEDCPMGHDTPEEAAQHNWEWEIDHFKLNAGKWVDPTRCQGPSCGRFATAFAKVPGDIAQDYTLCSRHMNIETLRSIHPISGGSIHS